MTRVLFARIGWMHWYRGPQPDDPKPIGGGKYNKQSVGHEAFNFLPFNGRMFGYFQPKLTKDHPSSIALERIDPKATGDTLNDVLLVFVATDPKHGGQRIIGWYDSATVYRHYQVSKDKRRKSFDYFIETEADDAVRVPEQRRNFVVPGGQGAFGQANICYLLEANGKPKATASWINDALAYVKSYDLENPAAEPASEGDAEISDSIEITIDHAAGFQSNPRIRKAIEKYAMDRAEKHLRKLGYTPKDTHKNKPYDYLCEQQDADLYVEVKGTQDSGTSISLTPREVEHARKQENSALFIVHSVAVKGRRKPTVSSGTEVFLNPWDISAGTLKPRGYIFTLKT